MPYDPTPYRSLFPHIRKGTLWLNHAAIGPVTTRTRAAVDEFIANRSEGTIDEYPEIAALFRDAKNEIGKMIGAPNDRLAFVESASTGLNVLASGLDWKSGDRIVLNDMEFPGNVVPFLNLKRHGVEIDFIKNNNNVITPEMVEAAITPRTRLLSISFVQFVSGFKADLKAIGEVCKRHNVVFSVDGIQGLGTTPLNVQECGIDFLSTSAHKWLLSMTGTGFIYITHDMQERIHQRYAGWTSNKNFFSRFFDYRVDLDDTARRYEYGSLNSLGIVALKESVALLNEVGIDDIHRHLLDLTDRLFEFADAAGLNTVTPRDRTMRSGIVSFTTDHAEPLFNELKTMNIIVSLRDGKIRLSPHFYNTMEDIDICCSAMQSILTGLQL